MKHKDKQTHDQIVKLVDNLLQLNKQLQTTKLETQRQQIQRTIAHAEKKIDELVYKLYGLSEEEIEIIEQPWKTMFLKKPHIKNFRAIKELTRLGLCKKELRNYERSEESVYFVCTDSERFFDSSEWRYI